MGLPVYNGEQYLTETLESLLDQTYENFELIIADNASTDNTLNICKKYARQDSRIRILHSNQNYGATWNYNRIVPESKGEYFRWAAGDDLVGRTYLERCVDALDRHPDTILSFPQTVLIDETGEIIGNYPNRLHLQSSHPHKRLLGVFDGPGLCNPIFGLMRIEALKHTTLIESYISSDRVLLGQLALLGKFYEVPDALFYRRLHPETSVAANPDRRNRLAWFDPRKNQRLQLPNWRRFIVYLGAIARTNMSTADKFRSYDTLFRRYLGHPGWMAMDFIDALLPRRSSVGVQRQMHRLRVGKHPDLNV